MSNIIDTIRVSGTDYTLSATSSGGNPTVELTQAEYDALVSSGTVDPTTFYIITDAQPEEITITSAVTSGSTAVVTSGGVYYALNGLKLVKLTQAEYTALSPNYDSNTVYFIGDSNGYTMKIGNTSVN